MSKINVLNEVKSAAVLPLFYNDSLEVCKNIVKALYNAGIRCIEFTNRGKNALDNFKALIELKQNQYQDLLLGIGTIKNENDARVFVEAKADFLVSPFFVQEISDYVNDVKVPWIPGCMTPTEIQTAALHGHFMVKLFPGNILSPSFVSAVKPLFPEIEFLITGGVTTEEENIKKWFAVGATAVGLGSNLISNNWSLDSDYDQLTSNTKAVLELISKYKN
ncbi:MAG: bifunctional 4-hydroxy-2-oxoglutarate aldolase/2-dehydro-3-deoxy-phosphogluconate aldolase [Chitinophagaceae bacterium]|nr:MAG: bifunctional 4-hydroxy-2-oxoglutarate aldolase/2-dehydro-3-deoxy-phosphogluconate aldolase [Chitinophagaceae bacterium]